MKYCPKCGEENYSEAKFCKSCGASFDGEVKEENKSKNESLGTASIVIGIVALIFALGCFLIFPIFITIPLSLVGLVLGIVNKAKGGNKFAGIILNVVAFILTFVFLFLGIFVIASYIENAEPGSRFYNFFNRFYNIIERETSSYYVSGKYNCKSFDGQGAKGDYIVRFELNKDHTFLWAKYDDAENNYVKGTYTFTNLNKTNYSGDYAYYNVKLTGDEFYDEGKKQDEKYISEYEFGITKEDNKKQGIVMNVKSYNMYYCFEE